MLFLVTGGAGFIGSHLVDWLVRHDHSVRVLDNFSTGTRENLAAVSSQVDVREGDICDLDTVIQATRGVDVVFHLAAMVSVEQSVQQPVLAHATNATGSLHVLEAARVVGVRRVVQMSSCAVYGNPEQLPIDETTPPDPLSPYAVSKRAAEQYGVLYSRLYGIETVALRGFNIYGPRQDPHSPYSSVIPRFLAALSRGEPPVIFGDGLQSRDFVFVGDVVSALWAVATTDGLGGEVLNIGSGKELSIRDLAQTIGTFLGQPIAPRFEAARSGEARHSRADVSRLAERTGFRPQTSLREGLEAWYNSLGQA